MINMYTVNSERNADSPNKHMFNWGQFAEIWVQFVSFNLYYLDFILDCFLNIHIMAN